MSRFRSPLITLIGLSLLTLGSSCSLKFRASLSTLLGLVANPSSVPQNLSRVSGNAQTGVVAQTLALPLVILVTDAGAVPVSGALVTFSITSGGGSLSSAAALTDALGQAQVTWTLGTSTSVAHTVQVDSSGLTSVIFTATANPGAANQLVFTQAPTSGIAGVVFGTQPRTQVSDSYGNAISSGTAAVTLSLFPTATDCTNVTNAIATNLASGPSILGTNPATTAAGLSTFTNIAVTRAGPSASGLSGNVYLRATNGAQTACSGAIAMTNGTISDLTLTLDSSSDVATSIALTVKAVDAYLNIVTSYVGTVAFTHPTGTAHGSDVLPSNYTFLAGDAGQRSFTANLRKAGVSHVLRATDTVTAGYSGDTSSFTLTAGPQTALSVTASTTPPSNVVANTCSAGFDVCRLDAYGNFSAPASSTTLNTITGRGQGNFFSDASCSTTYNTPVISASAACKTVYFKDTFGESLTLTFPHATLTSTTSVLSVDGIFYGVNVQSTSGVQTLDVNLADMDGDGKPDLVYSMAGAGNIRVRLGTGAAAGAPPYFGADTQSVARAPTHNAAARIDVGDMDGDGNRDVVTLNATPGARMYVSLFKGDGAGNIGPQFMEYDLGATYNRNGVDFPPDIKIIDINGDGVNDVIMTTQDQKKVLFLKNDGSGNLTNVGNVDLGGTTLATIELATGLINGDAKMDFAVSVTSPNQVQACINTTTPLESNGALWTFDCSSTMAVSASADGLDLGDINADGFLDLAVAAVYGNKIALYLGNGTGAFGAATEYATQNQPNSVKIGDFDGDGNNDVYAACQTSSRSTLWLNSGSGVMANRSDYMIGNSGGARIAKGFLNGAADTKMDAVTGGWTALGVMISK